MKANWDKRFMDLASHVSSWSKDNFTQVGCVVVDDSNTVLSLGYNSFPRNADDDVESRHERPKKNLYMVHAEANAIYNSSRMGVSLLNATAYVTYFPCHECAKAIINSGIKKIVTYRPDFSHPRWGESFTISNEILKETGVEIKLYEHEK